MPAHPTRTAFVRGEIGRTFNDEHKRVGVLVAWSAVDSLNAVAGNDGGPRAEPEVAI